MPTENRSSNTEMVSEMLPCPFCGQKDFLIERLDSDASVVICQGLTGPHEACLARGPVGVAQDEGEEQPGRDKAVELWNATSEQRQGEPVGEVVAFGKGLHEIAWSQGKMPRLGAKLYTRPAPADTGEVEQLRAEVKRLDLMVAQADHNYDMDRAPFRRELAERDALLRESYAELLAIKAEIGFRGATIALIGRIDAVLSASEEPSAPAEVNEHHQ